MGDMVISQDVVLCWDTYWGRRNSSAKRT